MHNGVHIAVQLRSIIILFTAPRIYKTYGHGTTVVQLCGVMYISWCSERSRDVR